MTGAAKKAAAAAVEKTAGYKTLALNVLAILLIVADQVVGFLQTLDYSPLIPPSYLPYVTIGLSVLNIVLRIATTGPTPVARYVSRWNRRINEGDEG